MGIGEAREDPMGSASSSFVVETSSGDEIDEVDATVTAGGVISSKSSSSDETSIGIDGVFSRSTLAARGEGFFGEVGEEIGANGRDSLNETRFGVVSVPDIGVERDVSWSKCDGLPKECENEPLVTRKVGFGVLTGLAPPIESAVSSRVGDA